MKIKKVTFLLLVFWHLRLAGLVNFGASSNISAEEFESNFTAKSVDKKKARTEFTILTKLTALSTFA